MTQIQISLPEAVSRFIEEQVASGRYGSASDLVVDLVEKARLETAKQKLTELVLEGENSGEGVEFDEEAWRTRTAQLQAEAQRRRTA